jgi:hypothetical protein
LPVLVLVVARGLVLVPRQSPRRCERTRCVSGAIAGEAFVACDAVLVRLNRPKCGLGGELVLGLAALRWIVRRRRVR